MIGGFRSVLFVSVIREFQGSLLVIVIMIESCEKRNCKLDFKFQSSHVIEKRSKSHSIEIW